MNCIESYQDLRFHGKRDVLQFPELLLYIIIYVQHVNIYLSKRNIQIQMDSDHTDCSVFILEILSKILLCPMNTFFKLSISKTSVTILLLSLVCPA